MYYISLLIVIHLFDVCYEIELVVMTRESEDTIHHLPYYWGVRVHDVILLSYYGSPKMLPSTAYCLNCKLAT